VYVIGTAGHVDHGKSTLVKALTNIDPDRLQEEKSREMTIELGFAWLTLPSGREVSVVDVPGHERFIKNMVAGVGGMDLAMLVVASDESVMPQTREHLAILDLLRVKKGLVVLSKSDLVDNEWLELVKLEVADSLLGSSLQGATIVPVSATTGQGLEELKGTIETLLEETPSRKDLGRPRLPVDRSFTMAGFGTVVTGTLLDGYLKVGQEVVLVPSGKQARIRGIQTHRQAVDSIGPGRRVAVNLSGLNYGEVDRGEVLTIPGWLTPTHTVSAHLRIVPSMSRGVKHNLGVTFHAGTNETNARLRLLDTEELKPGQEGWAQFDLQRPMAMVKDDSFIIRSAQWTLGGGEVVDPKPRRHRRFQAADLQRLEVIGQGSTRDLLLQILDAEGLLEFQELVRRANISQEEAREELETLRQDETVLLLVGKEIGIDARLLSANRWNAIRDQVVSFLSAYHEQYPLRAGVAREQLRQRMKLAGASFQAVLAHLALSGVIVEEGPLVRSEGHQVQLSEPQESTARTFLKELEQNPFSPPGNLNIDSEILGVLLAQNRVIRVNEQIIYATSAYEEMLNRILGHLNEHGEISVGHVRDMFDTSRKYAVPLLEYLDTKQITRRRGDARILMSVSNES
jgi:selenocysteine-specific elongation factor